MLFKPFYKTINRCLSLYFQEAASEIILAGPDTLGISLNEMSDQLKRELQNADLVIAKGQANYYALTEYRPKVPGKIA
ncbi:MAG: DUF89 family protein, partial [Candidatus Atribacteria bacterium]|nr:DUF89 family protein [Candidatus Atribacteria bacterium]